MERCHENRFAEETRPFRTNTACGRTETDRPIGDRRLGGDGAIQTCTPAPENRAAALRDSIRQRIGDGPASRYFGDSTEVHIDDNRVTLRVANGFLAAQIERRYGPTLQELSREAGTGSLAIEVAQTNEIETLRAANSQKTFTPGRSSDRTEANEHQESAGREAGVTVRGAAARDSVQARRATRSEQPGNRRTGFPAHHRFESFVVGSANRVAYQAARHAAWRENPGGLLLIHGPCGVGKTHLLNAIARETLSRFPGARVRVTSGERFIREYVASVRNNTISAFQKRHRELDLLCLDDVHSVAGKAKTQIELVQTLKALGTIQAQIALVSDEPPKQIEALNTALASRLSGGLIVRLDPPDQELRTRIARSVGERRRLPMSEGACRVIAEGSIRIDGTLGGVRELEGLVLQTEAVWKLEGGGVGTIGVETAARAVAARGGAKPDSPQAGPISIRAVIAASCREIGVELAEFTGRTRVRRVVLARSLAVLVARRHTNLSFPEIARAMKRPNHSTVITQLRAIGQRSQAGEPIKAGTPLDGLTIDQAADRIAMAARRLG